MLLPAKVIIKEIKGALLIIPILPLKTGGGRSQCLYQQESKDKNYGDADDDHGEGLSVELFRRLVHNSVFNIGMHWHGRVVWQKIQGAESALIQRKQHLSILLIIFTLLGKLAVAHMVAVLRLEPFVVDHLVERSLVKVEAEEQV